MDGEQGLFEARGAVGEGKRGPGDVGISDVLLVLLGLVASGEEPRLGMMNCWHSWYALRAKMTSCEEYRRGPLHRNP